ncbi:hypothetical protein C6P82_10660 [Burkholderia multivorans]|nr:hypothetical protein C6P82_10660 [Burkholderia multivorans]
MATEARGWQRVSMYAGSTGARGRCTRMFRRDDRQRDARHLTSRGEQMTNEPRTTNDESRHESRASLRTCDVMMERAARDAWSTNPERPDERAI